jgi:hypothetical protein
MVRRNGPQNGVPRQLQTEFDQQHADGRDDAAAQQHERLGRCDRRIGRARRQMEPARRV